MTFRRVCERLGRDPNRSARLYLWRAVRSGTFPAAVQVSKGRIAWRGGEIEAWIANLPQVHYAGKDSAAQSQRELAGVEMLPRP